MTKDLVPDSELPDISGIDWKSLDEDGKRIFWRDRRLEWLSSDHSVIKLFCKSRGLDYSQYWTDGWLSEKEMIVQNAEMMVSRMFEGQIADVIQLAYSAEQFALFTLTQKLKKENTTLKVKDLVQIISVMRVVQGLPNSVEAAKSSGKKNQQSVQLFDLDGNEIKDG